MLSNKSTSIAGVNDDDYLGKVLRIFYSKFGNTAHNSNMFGIVYSSIQKFNIILIMKPTYYFYLDNEQISRDIYLSR